MPADSVRSVPIPIAYPPCRNKLALNTQDSPLCIFDYYYYGSPFAQAGGRKHGDETIAIVARIMIDLFVWCIWYYNCCYNCDLFAIFYIETDLATAFAVTF